MPQFGQQDQGKICSGFVNLVVFAIGNIVLSTIMRIFLFSSDSDQIRQIRDIVSYRTRPRNKGLGTRRYGWTIT